MNSKAKKLKKKFDIVYLDKITFLKDLKIIFKTFLKVVKRSDISQEGMDTAQDLGDYLLEENKITQEQYNNCIEKGELGYE